jgi:hypothetical protein
MTAVVIYESMYGCTRQISDAIARGIGRHRGVVVVPVREATPEALAGAELVVVGGPTHIHTVSRPSSRKAAVTAAGKADGPHLEPGAEGPGVREWLATAGPLTAPTAAFDTRLQGRAILTGRASKRIDRALRRLGANRAAAPRSFLVQKDNTLVPGELERAEAWGAELGACNTSTDVVEPAEPHPSREI